MEENDNIDKDNDKETLINEKEKEEKINEEALIKNYITNNHNPIPKKNEENINTNIDINTNQIQVNQNNNQEIYDYLINIQYSKIFHFPYFYFGNIFHFYFPCQKFSSNQVKLSEMPTPPFAIVRTECKYIFLK